MTGINYGRLGQCEQAAGDAAYEFAVVSAGEVGAADASAEESVACDYESRLRAIICYGAFGVARYMNHDNLL